MEGKMFNRVSSVLILAIIFTGCNSTSDLEMIYNPIKGLETGAWQMALIVEANTNFSSLIFDKTEAKFGDFAVHTFQQLPNNSSFFVIPCAFTDQHGRKSYDKTYGRLVESYLKLNGYGKVTNILAEADYIITISVQESARSFLGSNRSNISITISETDETPVFFARASIESSSDSNFYYRHSKQARPVTYLTLKGFERIFKEAIPQAFA
jgi:hypothetical protein